jgi:hypothetical protein
MGDFASDNLNAPGAGKFGDPLQKRIELRTRRVAERAPCPVLDLANMAPEGLDVDVEAQATRRTAWRIYVELRENPAFTASYRRGFDIMILSPKAGGVGLTLTAANHVIHLSRWWNPAVEDQSTDRVYRIGQRKDVHVHYLQATLKSAPGDSFDERLHVLLQKKRALSRDLLWPFESEATDAASLLGRI